MITSSDLDLSLSSLPSLRLSHLFNLNLIHPLMCINTDYEEELDSPGNLLYWRVQSGIRVKLYNDSRNMINDSLVKVVYMITFLNHSFTVHST